MAEEKTYQAPEAEKLQLDEENPPEYSSPSAEPPPEYDSLFGKVQKCKDESSGNADFASKMIGLICCGTICCGIYIAFMLAIPLSMIIMGSLYLNDCPAERYIPIYLVVGGVFGVLKAISNITEQCCIRKKQQGGEGGEGEQKPPHKRINPFDGLVNTFLMAWFIAGCVWIYRTRGNYQHEDPSLDSYCYQTLYLYAFWLQTAHFIFAAIALFLCCCACCVFCFVGILGKN